MPRCQEYATSFSTIFYQKILIFFRLHICRQFLLRLSVKNLLFSNAAVLSSSKLKFQPQPFEFAIQAKCASRWVFSVALILVSACIRPLLYSCSKDMGKRLLMLFHNRIPLLLASCIADSCSLVIFSSTVHTQSPASYSFNPYSLIHN